TSSGPQLPIANTGSIHSMQATVGCGRARTPAATAAVRARRPATRVRPASGAPRTSATRWKPPSTVPRVPPASATPPPRSRGGATLGVRGHAAREVAGAHRAHLAVGLREDDVGDERREARLVDLVERLAGAQARPHVAVDLAARAVNRERRPRELRQRPHPRR